MAELLWLRHARLSLWRDKLLRNLRELLLRHADAWLMVARHSSRSLLSCLLPWRGCGPSSRRRSEMVWLK